MQPPPPGPLDGVRVLDFSRVLAGPFCTMILGDLGADVIKVERPGRGDDTREWGPPWSGEGEAAQSAYYLCANRNKRSITLNLKAEAGRDLARRLAAQSHVVVENFVPGQMAGFGLGYDDLSALNPALVYCSITGFGQSGPYRDRPGYDYVIQAMSGLMSITGPAEGEPVKVGVAISDVIAGLFAATSILAALRHAERTGQGQHLDLALLDTQIAALVNVASNYLVSGEAPARTGNQHPNIVPYQTFRAADGEFVLAVGNDAQFARLCRVLGVPELAEDERYATNAARVAHREEVVGTVARLVAAWRRDELVAACSAAGVPATPVLTLPEAFADPQARARGSVVTGVRPDGTAVPMVASPLWFASRADGGDLGLRPDEGAAPVPPALGEHSLEVLTRDLGMPEDEALRLAEEGVVVVAGRPGADEPVGR